MKLQLQALINIPPCHWDKPRSGSMADVCGRSEAELTQTLTLVYHA